MKTKPKSTLPKKRNQNTTTNLFDELRQLIEYAQSSIASAVNIGLTLLYWQVGKRIQKEILKEERAEYGRTVISSLSQQLTLEYGNGFNNKNLHRMVQFAEVFLMNKLSFH